MTEVYVLRREKLEYGYHMEDPNVVVTIVGVFNGKPSRDKLKVALTEAGLPSTQYGLDQLINVGVWIGLDSDELIIEKCKLL